MMNIKVITLLVCTILFNSACTNEADKVEIKEEKVSIGDYSINYKNSGKGEHIIIFESGLGMSSETWTEIQAKLSENYRVISYDRSGYGKSENSKSVRSIDNIVNDLKLLLDKIDTPAPYILVGHSLGGYVIRNFAKLYPEKVSGMVMIDSYHENLFKMLRDSMPESEWNKYLGTEYKNNDTLSGVESERVEFMKTVLSNEEFKIPNHIPVHVLTSLEPSQDTSRFVNVIMDLHEKLSLSFVTENDNVNQTITKSSGHFIYLKESELVISAIDNVIKRIENKNNR
ncbi:MAG: alpha/beta fold hydrolase [Bacteroidales bacterium]|nr:alpha/beta fold hydrolase [Bacteroidales bacterium]